MSWMPSLRRIPPTVWQRILVTTVLPELQGFFVLDRLVIIEARKVCDAEGCFSAHRSFSGEMVNTIASMMFAEWWNGWSSPQRNGNPLLCILLQIYTSRPLEEYIEPARLLVQEWIERARSIANRNVVGSTVGSSQPKHSLALSHLHQTSIQPLTQPIPQNPVPETVSLPPTSLPQSNNSNQYTSTIFSNLPPATGTPAHPSSSQMFVHWTVNPQFPFRTPTIPSTRNRDAHSISLVKQDCQYNLLVS
jgi:hypothetical protein